MLIRIWATTGLAVSDIEDVIEVPDGLSEDEIDEKAYDAVMERIDYGWEDVRDGRKQKATTGDHAQVGV